MNIVHNIDDAVILFGESAVQDLGQSLISTDLLIDESNLLVDALVEVGAVDDTEENDVATHHYLVSSVTAELFGLFGENAAQGWSLFVESAQQQFVHMVGERLFDEIAHDVLYHGGLR